MKFLASFPSVLRLRWKSAVPEEATHLKVRTVRNPGCSLTEGKIYRIKRDFSNSLFEAGEAYVIDDEKRKNYAVWLSCEVIYLKK